MGLGSKGMKWRQSSVMLKIQRHAEKRLSGFSSGVDYPVLPQMP